MPALLDPLADAPDRRGGRRNPEVMKLDLVAMGLGAPQQLGMGDTAQWFGPRVLVTN